MNPYWANLAKSRSDALAAASPRSRRHAGASLTAGAFLALGLLGGCGPASQTLDAPVQRQWKRLSDGSFFETHNPYDTGEPLPEVLSHSRIASRCWPEGKRYDCIVLSFDHDGGTAASVVAERVRHLSLADSGTTGTGYSCSASELKPFGILYHETIASDAGDQLLENMQTDRPPYETGWRASFVEKFMDDNGVSGGGRFFNCLGLRQLLDDGGPATLGTTAATRDQFFNSPGSADTVHDEGQAGANRAPEGVDNSTGDLSVRDARRAPPADRELEMGMRIAIELNEQICAQTGQNCDFAAMARRQHEERYGGF